MIAILSTYPKDKSPQELIDALLEKKLAACVNVVSDVKSHFFWNGAVSQEDEMLLIIKSKVDLFGEIESTISELHPYDCPEIIGIDIPYKSKQFAKWLNENVK